MKVSDWELLELRAIEEDDLAHIKAWQSKPDLRDQFVGLPLPLNNLQVHNWWLQQDYSRTPTRINFCIRYEAIAIGLAFISGIDWLHRHGSLSIYIGESSFQGRGIGSKSLRIVLDYAFRSLGLHRLSATVLADNARSVSTFCSAGFVHEGVLKGHYYVNGSWSDAILLGLVLDASLAPLPSNAHSLSGMGDSQVHSPFENRTHH